MTRTSKKTLFGKRHDRMTLPLASDIAPRVLLTYLAARAGRFPRGIIADADLAALKNFVSEHSDLRDRCGVTEDEMDVLRKAVEGA